MAEEASTTTTEIDPSQNFGDALFNLLKPVVVECDTHMNQVFRAQHQLSDQIDELAKELEKFMSVAQQNPPPQLLPSVQTLMKAKSRIYNLNASLSTIKERLDRMERMANSDSSLNIPMFSSLFGRLTTKDPQQTSPRSTETETKQEQKPEELKSETKATDSTNQ